MSQSVLALGAWLKNRACLLIDEQVYWSPAHGDLSGPQACRSLEESVQRLIAQAFLLGRPIQIVAHDLHPDFFSSQLAVTTAAELGVPAVAIQHHAAHIAAVMAEHKLSGTVMGWALDGTGLGLDGNPWGGELIELSHQAWRRVGHLQPLALPGGDRAASEPWRMAASVLHAIGRADEIVPRYQTISNGGAMVVKQMLDRQFNSPLSTSAGRLFDAAASALNLAHFQKDAAQAAIQLEYLAQEALKRTSDIKAASGAVVYPSGCVDLLPVVEQLFDAPDVPHAAAAFHLALADALTTALVAAARHRNIYQVALGGGCLANRVLRDRMIQGLREAGLIVYTPVVACGDDGLALGQAWLAARQSPTDETEASPLEASVCV